jgi:hypothetical protein
MENLESFENINPIETEPDPVLRSLWKKYNFPNKPPFKGSVAERRLKEACEGYSNLVKNADVINPRLQQDSENYFAKTKISNLGYETRRRELHNNIAVMVVGEQRSGMREDLATKIANFALEYASL